ncbi:MAG: hemerythrin family protein [Candidatus Brocadiales bacterium]|nr:hemerythrin family protein [Candidatus Brocadiales bacterium]
MPIFFLLLSEYYCFIIRQMVEWNDKFSVGISVIDEEHKKIIEILSKAISAKEHDAKPEELREVLREMTNYALKHFKTEEDYMKEFNYTDYQSHREEHRAFFAETIAYHDKVIEGDCQIANEIIEYLKWWLVNHIQVTDKKYVACFNEHGLK